MGVEGAVGIGTEEGRMWDLAFNLCVGLGAFPTPTLTRAGPYKSSLFYTWGGEGGTLKILFVKK